MPPRRSEQGFSLVETIFVVALLAGIMLVLSLFLNDYMRREHMRGVAEYMKIVQRAVDTSVGGVEDFGYLYSLAQANGNVIELSVLAPLNPNRTVGYTPAGGASLEAGGNGLKPNSVIHASFDPLLANQYSQFRDNLPLRASDYRGGIDGSGDNPRRDVRLSVIAKIVDDPAVTTDERAMEIMVVSVDRLQARDLLGVLTYMDARGGYISALPEINPDNCHSSGCQNTARSAFGNWYSDMPDFAGTYWYDAIFSANLPTEEEGYLVSYRYLNEAQLAGDYLYRIAIPGNPSLNRMQTGLDLKGNNIIGADNVEIRGAGSGPALRVQQNIHAQGSVFVGQNMQVHGDLIVDGDLRAGNMTVQPGFNAADPRLINATQGNIIVEGTFNTQDMAASGDVYAQSARMANMTAGQISSLGMDVDSTLTVERPEGIFAGQLTAGAATVEGSTRAGQLNTGTLQTGTLGMVSGDMQGGINVTNQRVQLDRYINTNGLNINNVTQCLAGC